MHTCVHAYMYVSVLSKLSRNMDFTDTFQHNSKNLRLDKMKLKTREPATRKTLIPVYKCSNIF